MCWPSTALRSHGSYVTNTMCGTRVRLDELEPGDLVFFTTEGRHVSHVGIAIGGDRFVHAPNARGTVRVDSLAAGYWGERVAGARRIE